MGVYEARDQAIALWLGFYGRLHSKPFELVDSDLKPPLFLFRLDGL